VLFIKKMLVYIGNYVLTHEHRITKESHGKGEESECLLGYWRGLDRR
jgi:hypothetical protein